MKTLIFADVHANLAALEAMLDAEAGWDEVFFLGDALLGGPQPNEVIDVMRTLDGIFLMGNHDRQALDLDLEKQETDPHKIWCQWTKRVLTPENRRFVERFTGPQAVERDGLPLRLLHGQLPKEARQGQRTGYIWPDTDEDIVRPFVNQYDEPIILHGHCHVQYRRQIGAKELINPGGLGQPRLGKALACYAVLEDGLIDLRAVAYDVEKTAAAMATMDLPAEFIAMWQKIYRDGILAPRYQSRDMTPLTGGEYR